MDKEFNIFGVTNELGELYDKIEKNIMNGDNDFKKDSCVFNLYTMDSDGKWRETTKPVSIDDVFKKFAELFGDDCHKNCNCDKCNANKTVDNSVLKEKAPKTKKEAKSDDKKDDATDEEINTIRKIIAQNASLTDDLNKKDNEIARIKSEHNAQIVKLQSDIARLTRENKNMTDKLNRFKAILGEYDGE